MEAQHRATIEIPETATTGKPLQLRSKEHVEDFSSCKTPPPSRPASNNGSPALSCKTDSSDSVCATPLSQIHRLPVDPETPWAPKAVHVRVDPRRKHNSSATSACATPLLLGQRIAMALQSPLTPKVTAVAQRTPQAPMKKTLASLLCLSPSISEEEAEEIASESGNTEVEGFQ